MYSATSSQSQLPRTRGACRRRWMRAGCCCWRMLVAEAESLLGGPWPFASDLLPEAPDDLSELGG